ncbi:MAG TPA: hypothetical protein VFG11_07765 [Acidobacteriota bacterium]|nr:hypothetical protein [Acidobacteriota bacterium]
MRTNLILIFLISLFAVWAFSGQELGMPVEPMASHASSSNVSCAVTQSPAGTPVSVLSQSDSTGMPMGWFLYDGPATSSMKFTMKFPSFSAFDKQVNAMSFPSPGASSLKMPLSFNWFPGDLDNAGLAIIKVKGSFGSCSYPVELADHGFESTDVPKNIVSDINTYSGIVVNGIDTIFRVRVSIWVTSPDNSKLILALYGPDGTGVTLATNESGFDFGTGFFHNQRTVFDDNAPLSIQSGTAPFVGAFIPESPLSAYFRKYGSAANGLWQLGVHASGGGGGTIVNWAIMIDDASGTKVTWSHRLTSEAFIAAGYTPTAAEATKLQNDFYSIQSILTGTTDRLVDTKKCSDCHSGVGTVQGPGHYYPNYAGMNWGSTHFTDDSMTAVYAWNDPNPTGLVYAFTNTGFTKPIALKLIFKKWLDDGALP